MWLTLIFAMEYQGGWEIDEDIQLAASRETLEEAGVIGLLGVSIFVP